MHTHHRPSSLLPRVGTSSMSTSDPDSTAARRTRSFSPLHPSVPDERRVIPTSAAAATSPMYPPPSPYTERYSQSQHQYSIPSADAPLIDRVTNEWMKTNQSRYSDDQDKEEEYEEDEYGQPLMSDARRKSLHSCPWRMNARTTLRYIAIYVVFLFLCLFFWKQWLKPTMDEEDILDASLYKASLPGHQLGTNAQPEFTDMIQLRYLDSQYVPGASHASKKRLIVVGDVHGCQKELKELMKKVAFKSNDDHLILAGDMIFKGPDSSGTIDYVRSLEASCVRGNHEDRTLLAYASLHSRNVPLDEAEAANLDDPNAIENQQDPYAHGDIKHRILAKQLSHDQIKWLKTCPVMLNVGSVGKKDLVVVHAGLQPGIKLEKQDPYSVMTMRTIDLDTRIPSEMRDGEPWEKVWNHYQGHLASHIQRKTVIYGHDSRRGLQLKSYSRGIDTGCVTGGRLTALIINEKGKEKTVSIKCKTNYRAESKI